MTNRIDRLLVGAAIVLSMAFLLRVIGQAVQWWAPQPWLPPFDAWQGSGIPYPVLLAFQAAILVLQARAHAYGPGPPHNGPTGQPGAHRSGSRVFRGDGVAAISRACHLD